MTLNEKLENFYTSVIDTATAESVKIIDEYKNTLQKIFDERKQAAVKRAENVYRNETEKIIREKNRRLSSETLAIRRRVLDKTAELTDMIFEELENKLTDFMKTPAYKEYLKKKINEAVEFARGDEITIYINPSDAALKSSLEEETQVALTISDRDFFGGIRAVIPSRMILIDHSFLTKLAENKNSFKFY